MTREQEVLRNFYTMVLAAYQTQWEYDREDVGRIGKLSNAAMFEKPQSVINGDVLVGIQLNLVVPPPAGTRRMKQHQEGGLHAISSSLAAAAVDPSQLVEAKLNVRDCVLGVIQEDLLFYADLIGVKESWLKGALDKMSANPRVDYCFSDIGITQEDIVCKHPPQVVRNADVAGEDMTSVGHPSQQVG